MKLKRKRGKNIENNREKKEVKKGIGREAKEMKSEGQKKNREERKAAEEQEDEREENQCKNIKEHNFKIYSKYLQKYFNNDT